MYRRKALLDIPFRRVMFAEDALWAKDAFTNKKTLVYDHSVRVFHYHHQSFNFYFRRNYIIQYLTYTNFNFLRSGKNLPLEIARILSRVYRIPCNFRNRLKWLAYNINLELAGITVYILFMILVKISGSKGADKGLEFFCKTIPQGQQ